MQGEDPPGEKHHPTPATPVPLWRPLHRSSKVNRLVMMWRCWLGRLAACFLCVIDDLTIYSLYSGRIKPSEFHKAWRYIVSKIYTLTFTGSFN